MGATFLVNEGEAETLQKAIDFLNSQEFPSLIDFDQFAKIMMAIKEKEKEEAAKAAAEAAKLQNVFNMIDENSDGSISIEEMATFLVNEGEAETLPLPDDFPLEGIDFEQFLKFMMARKKKAEKEKA